LSDVFTNCAAQVGPVTGIEMIRYKSVTKTVEEIVSVKCDKCGKEYDALDFEAQEFHHIKFTGGYASIQTFL
jgi:hypothetical protein